MPFVLRIVVAVVPGDGRRRWHHAYDGCPSLPSALSLSRSLPPSRLTDQPTESKGIYPESQANTLMVACVFQGQTNRPTDQPTDQGEGRSFPPTSPQMRGQHDNGDDDAWTIPCA
jgi:hypothetical protein